MAMAGDRAARASWASVEGLPFPLGATWVSEEEAWNFAVYTEHAERVTLLLYREEDVLSPIVRLELDHLRHKSGPVWHCRIPVTAMKGARFYAYQVDGPRSSRHRFDPAKILFDPYARAVYFPQGFDRQAAGKPGSNAGRAPLGLIAADRFDLASVFARRPDGSLSYEDPPIFGEIASDPELAGLRLIAEPWDAAGAYQLGRAFPGIAWSQWNGRFRDDLRRFVRGDAGMVPALMRRLYGSDDLFPDDKAEAYHAWQSVNFVTAHDGFTLWDLVSYSMKRNWSNGHDNRDGTDDNLSWNSGWEGDDSVPADVVALRKRQAKSFLCLLLFANGTPMLRAGDEFLQTQGGNNNPYNQDNETSWLDWRRLDTHRDVVRFTRLMIALRRAHPSLCRSRFWRDDVAWHGARGPADLGQDSHTVAFCLRGASQGDDDIYVMVNGSSEALDFDLQDGAPEEWRRAVDTGRESPDDIGEPGHAVPLTSPRYPVASRSVVVLVRASRSQGPGRDTEATG
jgi:pullulanase/glycogen debranching enzyme